MLSEYNKGDSRKGQLVDPSSLRQLSCGMDLTKKIVIGLNIIFLVLGVVVIGIGAYVLQGEASIYYTKALPVGIIVLGCFILVLSFFGCFGAMRESRVLLLIYAVILLCIFIAQLIIAALILANSNQINNYISTEWQNSSPDFRSQLQSDFGCCGLNNEYDSQPPCPPNATQACLPKLQDYLQPKLSLLGGFSIFLAIVQLLGVILALVLRSGLGGSYSFGTR